MLPQEPDFGEETARRVLMQGQFVLELSVDHLRTMGGVVVVIFEACGSLSSPRSTDSRKL